MITLLAITVVVAAWAEPDVAWYARLIGVEGVLVAAATLLIPVLARFSPTVGADTPGAGGPPTAIRFCASCGNPVDELPPIDVERVSTCHRCGLVFTVCTPDLATSSQASGAASLNGL